MKTLFVSLVAFLFAFIIGCQESSITDPVLNNSEINQPTEEPVFLDKDLINYYPGVIKLDGMLYDPSHFLNSFVQIKGTVRYRLDQIRIEKIPSPTAINVKLLVNAELLGAHHGTNTVWTVNNSSEDVMYNSSSGLSTSILEKSFRVRNTCCAPLDLKLKFKVNRKTVTLISMELKRVPDVVQIPD